MAYAIFGATGGIGRACAACLLADGKQVVAIARDQNKLALLPEGMIPLAADFENDPDGIVKRIVSESGPIDGMIYAAGFDKMTMLHVLKSDELETFLRIHALVPIRLIGQISKRGNFAENCSIVALSSLAVAEGGAGHTAYTAAKGALEGALKSMSAELAAKGIRFNLIRPGIVDTPMSRAWTRNLTEEQRQAIEKRYRLGRVLPDDVAQAAAFLLSSASSKITGQTLTIDSGSAL